VSGPAAAVPGRFAERVALVTGGGGAIGGAAALRFAAEGAAVVVADRDAARAQQLSARVVAAGGRAVAVACDVGEPAGAEAAVDAAVQTFGGLDAVFNNAGVSGVRAPVQELDVAAFDELMRINLRGVFLVLRASLRAMIVVGRPGAIVNMSSSMAGWDVLDGGAAYAASKHGVLGLTRTAALDAAPHGIRVNAVCPGVVQTTLGVPALGDDADGAAQLGRFAARIPLRRLGQPADVAAVTAFLASDDARHVTGAALLVDGGQTLQSWANAPDDAYPSVLGGPPDTNDPRR
jgi:NAD(P)-dependent dehydrogenase (short-subunit alcohol dehydrogenase family)